MKKIIATALVLLCITATAFALSLGGAPGIKHHGGVSMGNAGLVINAPAGETALAPEVEEYFTFDDSGGFTHDDSGGFIHEDL